jgi:hypothetical protein
MAQQRCEDWAAEQGFYDGGSESMDISDESSDENNTSPVNKLFAID